MIIRLNINFCMTSEKRQANNIEQKSTTNKEINIMKLDYGDVTIPTRLEDAFNMTTLFENSVRLLFF